MSMVRKNDELGRVVLPMERGHQMRYAYGGEGRQYYPNAQRMCMRGVRSCHTAENQV